MKNLRDLFLIRPGVAYLNHGAFGACPKPVFEAYQRWQLELEHQPLEFLSRRGGDLLNEARAVLGQFVGAASEDLAFVTNTTVGTNIVVRSVGLGPDDEVLAPNHEYGAMERAWRFVCAERGARYVKIHVPLPVTSQEEVAETIWAGVTPRTKVLFLSHISSSSSLIFPLERLMRRAREAGIITVIDGAHAPGQIALDLRALDADFYVGNCHKWLLSPKGAGFLYVRHDQHKLLKPLIISWGWRDPAPSTLHSMVEVQGTRDIAAFLSVPAAIRFQQEHHWPEVQRRCHEVVRDVRRQYAELTGLAPICPDSPQWFAQMLSLPLPARCNSEQVRQKLIERFEVEVSSPNWNSLPFLRVSIQAYNDEADVARLMAAMGALMPELTEAGRT